jgi:hypothetical protein
MNNFIKKIFGIDRIEQATTEAMREKIKAEVEADLARKAADTAKEEARMAKLTPKELATEKKEPWVAVLDTHVNKDNIRNGFFELDWNEYFILQLRSAGYNGENDEEIVNQWFNDLCYSLGSESGINMERRGSGYINVNNLADGKSEIF